jgi:hypothetical protein
MLWQVILGGFLVLLPVALLFDFHPERERCDAQGRPLSRRWAAPVSQPEGHPQGPHDVEHDH